MKSSRSFLLLSVLISFILIAANSVITIEQESTVVFPCPSNDILSGKIILDTFYRAEDQGAGFELIKVYLLGGDPTDMEADVILDSMLTDSNGSFEFTGLNTDQRYSLYFDDIPEKYGITGQSNSGSRNKKMFAIVPDCDIILGLSNPKENINPNPQIVIPTFEPGAASGNTGVDDHPGLVSVPFSPQDNGTGVNNDNKLAVSDMGSVWGTDYQCSHGIVFNSVILKRHIGMGPYAAPPIDGGEQDVVVDGIYMTKMLPYEGLMGGFTLQGVNGIDLGTVRREIITGAIPISSDTWLSDKPNALSYTAPDADFPDSYDIDAFSKTGKVGIGSITMGPMDAYLWAVNLNTRTLIKVDVRNPEAVQVNGDKVDGSLVESFPIDFSDLPNCNGTYRPWALEFFKGVGYLGVVCDAFDSQEKSDLKAYVLTFNPEDINVVENDFDIALSFDLDYVRESRLDRNQQWNAWVDEWPSASLTRGDESYFAQPMISDLEFDAKGRMVISLMDRFGNQAGYHNMEALIEDDHGDFVTNAAGDVLMACLMDDGSYELEGQGSCIHNNDDGTVSHGRLGLSDDGPSGVGEYFPFDRVSSYTGSAAPHYEITVGSAIMHAHHNVVLHTGYDVVTANYSQGVQQYNLETGALELAYQLTEAATSKANGLGDMAMITNDAPIEVGNYVWIDVNENGIQETSEEVLSGVNVSLFDMDGNLLVTVTTNSKGEYYFNDDTPGFIGMEPFTMYHIVIGLGQYDTDEQLLLGEYQPTVPNAPYFLAEDQFDSDFVNSPNAPAGYELYPSIKFTTGVIGYVNHSFDLGLIPIEVICPGIVSMQAENNNPSFCYDEGVVIDLEYSDLIENMELVYSENDRLTASQLYFGDRVALGINLLEESLAVTGTSTKYTTTELPVGRNYVYAKLLNSSEYVSDPNCMPFDQTMIIVNEDFTAELEDERICEGSDITLEPTITGGAEPYRFLWSNGSTNHQLVLTNVTSSVSYQLTITDAYDCLQEEVSNITVNNGLNVVSNDAEGCEDSEVMVLAQVSGGVAPYDYIWSNGNTTESFSVTLSSNQTFTVTVTDANGCSGETSMSTTVMDNLSVEATAPDYCNSENGQITLNIVGGNGNYNYQWTPNWINSDGSFNAENSFDYSVIVTDTETGCEGQTSGRVEIYSIPELDLIFDETTCAYFVLAPITGVNLSGNVGYFTLPSGQGAQYNVGDTIFSDIRLYVYDYNAGLNRCEDEVSFLVRITGETEDAVLREGSLCSDNSPYTAKSDNSLVLSTLLVSGPSDGAWTTDSMHYINAGILTVPAGSLLSSIDLTYSISGNPTVGGECGDKTFNTTVNIEECFACLGDLVWEDSNLDGGQDPDEIGIENVKITLAGVTPDGENIMAMTTTDANGNYLFCQLPAGNYKVTFSHVPGYTLTYHDEETTSDDNDSDADPDNALMSSIYTLVAGDNELTVDAGFFKLSKVGDYVWHDENADGYQDATEEGIGNCKVILTGTDIFGNDVDQMAFTDATGMYMFGDLLPGEYKVTFPGKPDFILSPMDDPGQNGDDASDSDANPDNANMTEIFTLGSADTIPTIDAGFYQYSSLGDFIWIDEDRDGTQDDNEVCLDGVRIYLYLCDNPDEAIDSTLSIDCTYIFDSLVPNEYFVRFVNPDEDKYGPTQSNTGDDAEDSDGEGDDLITHCTELESGEHDPTLDMGLMACPSLDTVSCKGSLQLSIGHDGEILLNPGMFLSINYFCDNLDVNILDSIGNDYGDVVTCDMIGKEYIAMISDPATGNSCWSRIYIEDKIPPVLQCPDALVLSCEDDPNPGTSQVRSFEVTPNALIGPSAGSVTTVPVVVPELGNLMIIGVNLYLDIDMDSPFDYVYSGGITLTSPQGSVYDLYPFNLNANCQLIFGVDGVDHGYDDASPTNFAVCQDFVSQNDFVPFGAHLDNTFSGEEEQGVWTWTVTDRFDLQGGVINKLVVELELSNSVDLPIVTENCNYKLTYSDGIDNRNNCGIGQVTRIWTAVDQAGNSATCEQTLSFEKQDNLTEQWPVDYVVDCFVDPSALVPDALPTPYNRPRFSNTNCTNLAVGSVDSYFDICSPYGYQIRRTWTVLDWCNPDPNFELVHIQLLRVQDTVAPEIVCPSDMIFTLRHDDCFTNVSLTNIGASDNCDTNPTVTRALFNSDGNQVSTVGVEVGEYRGRYIGTDACGNEDTCWVNVSVIDPVAPVATCFGHLVVSLTSNGWAYLCADQVNNGSTDNCTDVGFQIKREDQDNWNFYNNQVRNNNCIKFTCRDIGDSEVTLRVWDDSDGNGLFGPQADTNGDGRIDENDDTTDNYSECSMTITVEDKLPPVLVCPADITISCLDDYQDLGITGEADANGNCINIHATFSDLLPSPFCPGSIIERTWSTEKRLAGPDGILNTNDDRVFYESCVQKITLEDLTEARIVKWPQDITLSCDINPSVAEGDLTRYNYLDDYLNTPSIPGDDTLVVFDNPVLDYDCELLEVNAMDRRFEICENSYKIRRMWTILDGCNPDFSEVHEQIIYVEDKTPPSLTVIAMTDGVVESGRCDALVNFQVTVFDNCGNVSVRNNSQYSNSHRDATAYYPIGTHTILFTASDNCGNNVTEEVTFTVQDVRNPIASCVFGLAINLKADGTGHFNAEAFNAGSSDNCTQESNLKYTMQLLDENGDPIGIGVEEYEFRCWHIGQNIVRFIVTDEAGNEAYCETAIIVEDNGNFCTSTATYEGTIQTEYGDNIMNTELFINGISEGIYNGIFSVQDYGAVRSNFIELDRNTYHKEGVNTLDMIAIRRHIIKSDTIRSPYKLLAADVDLSETIDVIDLLLIRQVILREVDQFSNVRSWNFVPANFDFIDDSNPWVNAVPHFLSTTVGTDMLEADFIGYKIGDVNDSANPNINNNGNRSIGQKELEANVEELDSQVVVQIRGEDLDFEGYQMAIKFDADAFSFVENTVWEESSLGLSLIDQGIILVSWINETQEIMDVELVFERILEGTPFDLTLVNEHLRSEAYDWEGNTFDLILKSNSSNSAFVLYGNYPNPFSVNTIVAFDLPQSEFAEFTLYNISGEVVYETSFQANKGRNEIEILGSAMNVTGTYFYELKTDSYSASKKMTLIK